MKKLAGILGLALLLVAMSAGAVLAEETITVYPTSPALSTSWLGYPSTYLGSAIPHWDLINDTDPDPTHHPYPDSYIYNGITHDGEIYCTNGVQRYDYFNLTDPNVDNIIQVDLWAYAVKSSSGGYLNGYISVDDWATIEHGFSRDSFGLRTYVGIEWVGMKFDAPFAGWSASQGNNLQMLLHGVPAYPGKLSVKEAYAVVHYGSRMVLRPEKDIYRSIVTTDNKALYVVLGDQDDTTGCNGGNGEVALQRPHALGATFDSVNIDCKAGKCSTTNPQGAGIHYHISDINGTVVYSSAGLVLDYDDLPDTMADFSINIPIPAQYRTEDWMDRLSLYISAGRGVQIYAASAELAMAP